MQKTSSNAITNRIEDLMIFDGNLNLTKTFDFLEINYGFGGKQQLVESTAYNQVVQIIIIMHLLDILMMEA